MKILSVFGTRPEATKMCPLVKAIDAAPDMDGVVCVTAQHRQMLDDVLELYGVTPQYDLDIMKQRQSTSYVFARVLEGVDDVIVKEQPDVVLVHGDTATSVAAALAAFYRKIPVGHVEAGLRSFDKYSPYPEELNRCLTDIIADIYFAPTGYNRDTLLKEGIPADAIVVTGNTAIDALSYTGHLCNALPFAMDDPDHKLILMTTHRNENLGEPMRRICNAMLRVVRDNPDVELFIPVHMNPAVREVVLPILGDRPRIHLTEPISAHQLIYAMKRCYICVTDSGGLQEEAPTYGAPLVILREETERPEGIDAGIAVLTGSDERLIYDTVNRLLRDADHHKSMVATENPYGDGRASERIVDALRRMVSPCR